MLSTIFTYFSKVKVKPNVVDVTPNDDPIPISSPSQKKNTTVINSIQTASTKLGSLITNASLLVTVQSDSLSSFITNSNHSKKNTKKIEPIEPIKEEHSKCNSLDVSRSSVNSAKSLYCRNLSSNLLSELDAEMREKIAKYHIMDPDPTSWKPPKEHGLKNSSRIIPEYYLTNKLLEGTLFEFDYYYMVKDDIRNLRPLSIHQLRYIKSLGDEEKMEIIEIFNQSMSMMVDTLQSRQQTPELGEQYPKSTST